MDETTQVNNRVDIQIGDRVRVLAGKFHPLAGFVCIACEEMPDEVMEISIKLSLDLTIYSRVNIKNLEAVEDE